MRTATSAFLLLLSSLDKLFVLSQTCISHHGCEKYSNLWCLDKRKMDFQVNKLTVDISTNPGKNSQQSLSTILSQQRQITHSPQLRETTKKTYFKMYCFKSTFLKH